MLPPAAWVTVAQRTELLPIVRLTDGFHRSNHLVAEDREKFKITRQESPLPLSNDLAEMISNPGFIGYMAPDTSVGRCWLINNAIELMK